MKTRVAEILELVDLAGRENRKPRQLSGGQQQRVALARAIVNNPRVLLLDEPLGALDLKLRKQMQLELKRIQNEVGITFVHVTHDQEEAMTMADTIAVMNGGRIEQLGTPAELYERPGTAFVAGFLGKSNLLDGTITGEGLIRLVDGSELRASTNGTRGPVSIGVRPEKISLGDGGVNRLTGKVKESAYIGVATEVVVVTSVGELTVFHQNVEAGGVAPRPGSAVTLSWSPEATFVDPLRRRGARNEYDDHAPPARPAGSRWLHPPVPSSAPRGVRWRRWRRWRRRRAEGRPQLLELGAVHRHAADAEGGRDDRSDNARAVHRRRPGSR